MSSEDLPSLESTLTRPGGLTEHLLEQLRMAGLTPEEERVGALIIGNLDRDGYLVLGPDGPTALERELLAAEEPAPAGAAGALSNGVESHAQSPMSADAGQHADADAREDASTPRPAASGDAPAAPEAKAKREKRSGVRAASSDPLLAIALEAGVTAATVEKVQRCIQRFDPVGCASRDLRECLLAQAHWFLTEGDGKDDPDADLLPQIIGRHLKNVETKKYPAIARDLQVELNEVVAAIKLLGRLEPKPGRLFNIEEPQYITPDVYIHKVGDSYVTVLNDDGLSKLRISQHYRNALRQGGAGGAKAKDYIQEKLRSAVWLIRSIHQRQRTIVKVTDSIIKFQRDFLDKGIAYLRPLILRDVAEDIGMHESTVSRVTTNKYVHTPQGIYELKYFFNSSIARVGGEDIASEAVKNQIRQIIAKEPADKPFSDQKIVEILRSQNVDIARRTVAKYREVLGILPSSKRKRYF
jgi:RNA polymerase sigma-54 factor